MRVARLVLGSVVVVLVCHFNNCGEHQGISWLVRHTIMWCYCFIDFSLNFCSMQFHQNKLYFAQRESQLTKRKALIACLVLYEIVFTICNQTYSFHNQFLRDDYHFFWAFGSAEFLIFLYYLLL